MPVDSAEFRRILGHWPTGVAIVTVRASEGRLFGLTANAFTSVSLDPPLVLVCIERTSDTHGPLLDAGTFAVSILPQSEERLARRFAADGEGAKFEGVAYVSAVSGAPVLDDALAWVDCRVHTRVDAGDHTIVVGEVLAGDAREGEPLLFYRGGYGRLTP